MPWTPWTDACWTAGSCASRWLAMAGPLRPSVEEAAAVADGMAEDANEVAPVTVTVVVVPARQIVPAADPVGLTPDHDHALGTGPARAANHPAARTPDPAAPWLGTRITKASPHHGLLPPSIAES